jgi:hypothetical protein
MRLPTVSVTYRRPLGSTAIPRGATNTPGARAETPIVRR